MILNIIIDEQHHGVAVTAEFLREAEEFFARMDRDLDQGWQMSREWVEHPTTLQRCQIAAEKLMTAVEAQERPLAMMMAGYILSRMPEVDTVRVGSDGEIQETTFHQRGVAR